VLALVAGGARALRRAVEGAEDRAADGRRAVAAAGLGADDVLVALSASGRTPYALAALREARRRGAATLAVTCAPDSALAREAGLALVAAVGPELLAGSTRMKSGTAQKAILNLLTTGAFARTGRVLGHLMVGVRPGSAKLRARAARIVAEAGSLPVRAAAALLRRAGGDVRVALVMRRRAVSARGARALLAGADLRSLMEGPA
jgi:N-acetylmuramic acid 6-phosphate etherase